MNNPRSHLIVALDVPDRATATKTIDQLSGHVGYFKIGLELFTREGPQLIQEIRDREEKIFLDLKILNKDDNGKKFFFIGGKFFLVFISILFLK